VANLITLLRMVLVLGFFIVEPFTFYFYALYIICGFSDMVDGYIARKTNTTSDFGAKLDTIADLEMVLVLLIILLPKIHLDTHYLIWMIIIIIIRLCSMIVVYTKYKQFGILHTYLNKVTGLLLFAFPLYYNTAYINIGGLLLCGFATLSALEELIIHFISDRFEPDRKSILFQ